jgi:hypothetical protein
MKKLKIFATSYFQIGLVAINTLLISKSNYYGVFIVSFLISLLWCFNVTKISVSSLNDKLTYALGAGLGSICGLYLVKFFI